VTVVVAVTVVVTVAVTGGGGVCVIVTVTGGGGVCVMVTVTGGDVTVIVFVDEQPVNININNIAAAKIENNLNILISPSKT
jgi:hypothetical protein